MHSSSYSDAGSNIPADSKYQEGENDSNIPSALSSPSRARHFGAGAGDYSDDEERDDDDDDRSAHSASSISQLLQQGQSAGKYAQTLRSILRTMDKKDSSVQLESLEQVLKLGHAIALQEKAGEKGEGQIASAVEVSTGGNDKGGRPPMHPTQTKRWNGVRTMSPSPSTPTPVFKADSGMASSNMRRRSRAGIALGVDDQDGLQPSPANSKRGPPISSSGTRPAINKPTPKKWTPTASWDNNVRVMSPAPGSVVKSGPLAFSRNDYSLIGGSGNESLQRGFRTTTPGGARSRTATPSSMNGLARRTTPSHVPGTANPKTGSSKKRVFGHRL